MEPQYLFILGSTPELAEEELSCVLPGRDLTLETFNLLGGTVKVAEIFSGSIAEKLIEGKKPGERIVFGLSGDANVHDAKEVKDELETLGFKARFVLPKQGESELSSVLVVKQMVDEIYLLPNLTAKTIWVQDFEDWGKRDYGRPAVDPHIGMLPPKVARMMVNVAVSGKRLAESLILDPFCGVGTILAEALTMGIRAFGSDINSSQIAKTKKNLDWLGKTCPLRVANAKEVGFPAVDAIVTEPDLGPNTNVSPATRTQIEAKLAQLYTACLEHWQKILKPEGKVVIVFPTFGQDDSFVKILIDKAKIMGYSLVSGPFTYYRPQAIVRRNICVFELATSH